MREFPFPQIDRVVETVDESDSLEQKIEIIELPPEITPKDISHLNAIRDRRDDIFSRIEDPVMFVDMMNYAASLKERYGDLCTSKLLFLFIAGNTMDGNDKLLAQVDGFDMKDERGGGIIENGLNEIFSKYDTVSSV